MASLRLAAAQREQTPARFKHGVGVEAAAAAPQRPVALEWDHQQSHMDAMFRCPHTFGHIVRIIGTDDLIQPLRHD